MKKQPKVVISHQEIAKALQKFQAEGGLIKRLPDQITPKGGLVGGKWAQFEAVLDPTAGSGSEVMEAASE